MNLRAFKLLATPSLHFSVSYFFFFVVCWLVINDLGYVGCIITILLKIIPELYYSKAKYEPKEHYKFTIFRSWGEGWELHI